MPERVFDLPVLWVACLFNLMYRYTTVGREILPQIKTGDVIRSVKLLNGQDRLVLPDEK